ncbi:MAG TPA: GlsB/YeaQ/YmgE family stress response membrane protein [Acidimicrobiales bacterium]|nr:GlsB/YeaQ/YmgE family stress response membrane protein [Acidimicrobiales bacterium]
MALIGFLILGLIAGAIARLLVPGRDPMGWLGTMVLGCVGALVGGFLARAIGDNDGVGLVGAVIGAIVVLLLWRAFSRSGDRARV